MKTAQVAKLYGKLSPQEQATLAFEACVRLDEVELDTILAHVPRVTYSGLHIDYRHRAAGLQNLARVYGLCYWKTHALAYMAEILEERDTIPAFLAKLKALEVALLAVCERYKVDSAAIKTLAECLPPAPCYDCPADDNLAKQYIQLFIKAVEL